MLPSMTEGEIVGNVVIDVKKVRRQCHRHVVIDVNNIYVEVIICSK